jgi:hypothetical protein
MQGGIYGLAYWMVDLKARGVLKRFTVAPVTKLDFIAVWSDRKGFAVACSFVTVCTCLVHKALEGFGTLNPITN